MAERAHARRRLYGRWSLTAGVRWHAIGDRPRVRRRVCTRPANGLTPFRDDIVTFARAEIRQRLAWQPNGEISEQRFFARDELPELQPRTLARIEDAFHGHIGVIRVFEEDTTAPPPPSR